MIMLLMTFLGIEAFLRPFHGVLRNALDLIFLFNLVYLLSSALYYSILRLSDQANADISRIMSVHYITVEILLAIAIFLTALILFGFVCARFGVVRKIEENLIPKLSPRLQVLVAAILEDAGYKLKSPNNTSRKRGSAKSGSIPTAPTRITAGPELELSMELDLDRGRGPELQEAGPDDLHTSDGEEIDFETHYSHYRDSILEQTTTSTVS